LSRKVGIVSSEIPGPYNILDLPEGQSVEFVAISFVEGAAEREIIEYGRRITRKGPIMRVFADLSTPVLGSPYLDILAGRTIAFLRALFMAEGLPLKLKFTAHGKEPSKWYTVEYGKVKKVE
jgi:hypothetical protein